MPISNTIIRKASKGSNNSQETILESVTNPKPQTLTADVRYDSLSEDHYVHRSNEEVISKHMLSWDDCSIIDNDKLERKIARIASESDTAHIMISALVKSVTQVFMAVERCELKAISKMIKAYSNPVATDYISVGQVGVAGFIHILKDASSLKATYDDIEHLTLREKATAFYALVHSAEFREALFLLMSSSDTCINDNRKININTLIDLEYLLCHVNQSHVNQSHVNKSRVNQKQINQQQVNYKKASDSSSIDLFSYPEALPRTEYSLLRKDSRILKNTANTTWIDAQSLIHHDKLTQRELNFHLTSSFNRPDRSTLPINPITAESPKLDEVVVQRGNGFAVWQINPASAFAKKTQQNQKPAIAGPSGTTDRFFSAAMLLKPAVKSIIGLSNIAQTDQSFKELMRWMCMGYLVDDQHHSMIEVALAASHYGLDPQWGNELYSSHFHKPIKTHVIDISDQAIRLKLGGLEEVQDHRKEYQTTL